MLDLAAAQAALFEGLNASGGSCFVRVCRDDGALWVSDAPRLGMALSPFKARLEEQGVAVLPDALNGLWRLDWTLEMWQRRLEPLPHTPPPLPVDADLHPAYALCRLMLTHPSPLERQPMAMVRRVAKLTAKEEALKRCVPALHGLCAQRLRKGEPLPSAAGAILAAWLAEKA